MFSQMFTESSGKLSMMRVIVFATHVVGWLMLAAGTVGMFYELPAVSTALTVGGGIIGIGEAAKAIQKKSEA